MLGSKKLKDTLFALLVTILALTALAPLASILYSLISKGGKIILAKGLNFFIEPVPEGIGPPLLSTLVLAFVALIIAYPVALAAALFMYEFPSSRLTVMLRVVTQSLVEIPTILVGLFVYAILVHPPQPLQEFYKVLGLALLLPVGSYSGFAGALALAIVVLPYLTVQIENIIRQVPRGYREAMLAIGASRFRASLAVVRIAVSGLITTTLTAFAKAIGETAPLLFTTGGGYTSYPYNLAELLRTPTGTISMLIYDYARMPLPERIAIAWGAAFTLTLMTMVAIIVAKLWFMRIRQRR